MKSLLETILNDPERATSLALMQWDILIPQARVASLLPTLYLLLEEKGLLGSIPERPRAHLFSGWVLHNNQVQSLLYELKWLKRAFDKAEVKLLLLKGAAYISGNLPAAPGRLISDIDLLVPWEKIQLSEAILGEFGWKPGEQTPYDERYYRQWMHEIPPLGHSVRGSILDVHHTILPPTAKPKTDPKKLFAKAQEIKPGIWVLAPTDMVIHSAAHLFHEGEFDHGLRDLLDLDRLLRHFGDADDQFWSFLLSRAEELDLQRPLYYALRYVRHYFHTPVPSSIMEMTKAQKPNFLTTRLMDFCFLRAFQPEHPSCETRGSAMARFILYVRSHYLRMPMSLLLPHLIRKAWMRYFPTQPESDE